MRVEAKKTTPSSLEIFLEEIKQFPPLSQEEVDTLYQEFILPGREIEQKKERGQNSFSPKEEEILEKAKKAKEKIFNHNLKLVVSLAYKKSNPTHPLFPDLIQAGSIGLLTAVNKYTPGYGTFSNYAAWWIYKGIRWEKLKRTNYFPLSEYRRLVILEIYRYRQSFHSKFGRDPTLEEISKGTQLSIVAIKNAQQLEKAKHAISLDAPADEERKNPLEEFFSPGPFYRPTEEIISEKEFSSSILSIENILKFPFLTVREAKILAFYLKGYSYSEIAKNWGLTKERIRQIKNKAVKKIQKYFQLST